MNKLDSNLVANSMVDAGFELIDSLDGADAVMINTCSVRGRAEEKVFSMLGRLKNAKKTRPEMVVVVFGCMAQRLSDELLKHEAVNVVCGPGQIPQLATMVAEEMQKHSGLIAVSEDIRAKVQAQNAKALDDFEFAYDSANEHIPSQAFVRIMRGCNNFCSYCVVPYVRGPENSRRPQAVIEQIKKLADTGVKQITLLGQTVNSYSYQEGDKTYGLADLLEMVSEIDGIEWIRFVTGHPKDFDERIFRAMADLPKVCAYLHMPAQSGADRVLKAMNRGYTAEEYLDLVAKAKELVPGIAVAGDFIVGFPGETEEDFAATVELVKKAQYKNCFVFKYSPRPGTKSDKKLIDDVSIEVKKRRNIELLAVQEEISKRHNESFVGQTVRVLVEGPSKKAHLNSVENADMGQLISRTATDYIVVFNGPAKLAGQFANVKITGTSALTLFGELSDA